jgi:hypothetical protein
VSQTINVMEKDEFAIEIFIDGQSIGVEGRTFHSEEKANRYCYYLNYERPSLLKGRQKFKVVKVEEE